MFTKPLKNISKLKYLSKYIWFDKSYTVKNNPKKVIAYAMRYADLDDFWIIFSLGDDTLKDVLKTANPGWFDEKNWIYWHTILEIKNIPTLPKRQCIQ